ncbi:hypothetical protein Tco_1185646 [Tanacetum coccineum]
MVGGAEIPQTRTSSRVRSTKEMDIVINDLNSKFASMSIVLEEIRSAIIGGGNHPNREGDEHDEDEGKETMDEYNRDWLYEVDKFFDIMEVLEEEQVKVVAYKLRGGARAWWQHEQDNRRAQGKRNVADYTSEFLRLQARCNLREMDEQSTARYISGLNSSIQERLILTPIWCVDQAQNMAMKAERMASKTGVGFRRSNIESLSNYGSRPSQIQSTLPSTTTTTSSSKASRSGVDKNKEIQPVNSNPYAKPMGAKCFRCGEPWYRWYRSNVRPKRPTYYSVESENDRLTVDEAFQEEDELEYAYSYHKIMAVYVHIYQIHNKCASKERRGVITPPP